jgi:hypothetical protein
MSNTTATFLSYAQPIALIFFLALFLIPPFAAYIARRLYAHSVAMEGFAKVVSAGMRAYARLTEKTMRETGQ